MAESTFNFSACFNEAWETYKKNLLLLVGASLVASLLASLSFGIIAGPLIAGLMILILKLTAGSSDAKFEDIFSQFDTFKTTFLLVLAWGVAAYIAMVVLMIVPVIGHIAAMVLSVGVNAFLLFAILLAAEKKLSFKEASTAAFAMLKKDLWPLMGYTAVAGIISGLGILACGIGLFFTMPLYYIMMAIAYRHCSSDMSIKETSDEYVGLPSATPADAAE